jgi:glutathione S-transferase
MSIYNMRFTKLQLRYSPASPFVRKVLVFAHETGLADQIELLPTDVWASDSDIIRDNPLGKVPALIGPDGVFIGSLLCCEYLDTLHTGERLIPIIPAQRWPALQLHALADGVMDAAVAHVIERLRRPAALVHDGYLERQTGKIRRTLDALQMAVRPIGARVDIGTITVSCALGYLDLRLPQLDWRRDHAALALWNETFSLRQSLAMTTPFVEPGAAG